MPETGDGRVLEVWTRRLGDTVDLTATVRPEDEIPTDFGPPVDADTGGLAIGALLGRGGHSLVHAAVQGFFGREVAVKSARTDVPEPDSRRLLHEARVTGALEHPNIVPVYGIDLTERLPRIVLKKIDGQAWSDVLAHPPSADPLAWNVRTLLAVCQAVAYAHDRGILHRDIKPQNVMVGGYGEVYLLDWGLACTVRERDASRFPLARLQIEPVGSPAYMAPEMALGDGERLGLATDVYLLGSTLFHVLAGRPPRTGGTGRVLHDALTGRVPDVPEDAPVLLRDLCARMLANEPDARPRVEEVRATLEAFLANRGIDRMLARAGEHLDALRTAIRDGAPELEVQERFGACRSVFEAVLETAPDREDAREGRREAVLTMVDHALARQDERTARFLVAGMTGTPAPVVARIQALEHATEQEREELDRLRQTQDTHTGAGPRLLVIGLVGAAWFALIALVGVTLPQGYLRAAVITGAGIGLAAPAVGFAWRALPPTPTNRRVLRTVIAMPLMVLPAMFGNWLADVPIEMNGRSAILVFLVASTMIVVIEDPRYIPSVVAWMLAYMVVSAFPGAILPALALGVLFNVANGVIAGLGRWRQSPG